MDPAGLTILITNLILGFGCAVPVARRLDEVSGNARTRRFYAMLIGMYLVESVAVAASMATMVFNIVLAFVWGIVFGRWLRRSSAPIREVLRAAFYLAVYSSLPALSLIVLPVLGAFAGWDVLSPAEGARFGIPRFVPWPMNTVLGLFGIAGTVALVLKTVITTGEVSLIIHLSGGKELHKA
ncbi:MAG TPA: hypothetical protein VFI02_11280 [Armatimonadota bacterium]|nr:hypothetical protein [Armatimonadota bacterium]